MNENRRLKVNPLYYHDFSRWLLGQALNLRDVKRVSVPLRKRLQEGPLTKQDIIILISFNNYDINESVFSNPKVPGALLYRYYLKNPNIDSDILLLPHLVDKLGKYRRSHKSKLRLLNRELGKNSKDISFVCSTLWRDYKYPTEAVNMCKSYIIDQCVRGLSRQSPHLANSNTLKDIDKDTLISEVKNILSSTRDSYEVICEFTGTLSGKYNYYSNSPDVHEVTSYLNSTFKWVNIIKEAILNSESTDGTLSTLVVNLASLEIQKVITLEERMDLMLALDVKDRADMSSTAILLKDIQQLHKKEGCHDGE